MKKIVLFFLLIITALITSSQDTTYYSGLRQGINISNQGYNSENFLELANICER
ncbi:MAG: hypothetical protein HQ541_18895, partial [Mariniphaga sp.]|nr:hypothetical protein [Mariniphaga sp.]